MNVDGIADEILAKDASLSKLQDVVNKTIGVELAKKLDEIGIRPDVAEMALKNRGIRNNITNALVNSIKRKLGV